jgi:rhamnulokinase
MQAYGSGEIASLPELRQIVRNSFEINTYQPEDTGIWESQYRKFMEVCCNN